MNLLILKAGALRLHRFLQNHAIAFAMLIGAALSVGVAGFSDFAQECERIPDDVLRLHIIAESNSKADQDFKLQLRDYILANFTEQLQECDSLESATATAQWLLPEIERQSRDFAGRSDIIAEVTEMYFTTRVYDNQTLPAGRYTALRITIGEGEGENWWCVMFPLLCVPAVTQAEEETTPAINLPEIVDDTPKIKFALFEFFAGLFK